MQVPLQYDNFALFPLALITIEQVNRTKSWNFAYCDGSRNLTFKVPDFIKISGNFFIMPIMKLMDGEFSFPYPNVFLRGAYSKFKTQKNPPVTHEEDEG